MKKSIFIILAVGLLTFGNSLFNGFVGDDNFVIVGNSFYQDWQNFPKLFSKEYISDSDTILNKVQDGDLMVTGSVAYRPVLSTTFFLDYGIWQKNPFGYHLSNLILHLVNSVLAYCIIFFILKNERLAFFSALLFCIHPIKSEAVCAIGYRADVLASFLAFWSFFSYLYYRQSLKKSFLLWASYIFYFLAIFTKEAVIVFPLLVMLYDWLVVKDAAKEIFRNIVKRYSGFIVISLFYLYVYIFVFPNSTFQQIDFSIANTWKHLASPFFIFSEHIFYFVFPFLVRILPPFYNPSVSIGINYQTVGAMVVMILMVYLLFKFYKENRNALFFLLWFLISYIPVSNIIPVVNPMAYRFMYFPSLGMVVVLILLLDYISLLAAQWLKSDRVGKIIKVSFIIFCIIQTVMLNIAWKNILTLTSHMLNDNPNDPAAYLLNGMAYYEANQYERAEKILLMGVQKGLDDPRGYDFLARSTADLKQAKFYFEKSIKTFPYYVWSYIGLGRLYLLERDFETAAVYLKQSIDLLPRFEAYVYLLQVYLLRGEFDQAKALYNQARQFFNKKEQLELLSWLFTNKDILKSPVDIGL